MKVYVSSTQADLELYRASVMAAIRGLGHEHVAMEDYHAEDAIPAEKCREDVARCDIYVGLIAWRPPIDPVRALSRCNEHANHFVDSCQQQVQYLHSSLGRKPVIAALFDTEHFGHWWHEGPAWLNLALRKLTHDQKTIKLITARDYLESHPSNQIVTPSMSSWGYQGYSETWLMGRNHWIYPALYEMIELLDRLVESTIPSRGLRRDALNQYFRELLLAQSSDWAFMMHAQSSQVYAEKRVSEHIQNMTNIYRQLMQDSIDAEWLDLIREKNNIFSNVDILEIYGKTS